VQAIGLEQVAGQLSIRIEHGRGDVDVLHTFFGRGVVLHQFICSSPSNCDYLLQSGWEVGEYLNTLCDYRAKREGATMKKLLLLVLLASAVSFAQQPGADPAIKAKILTRAEFDALLATPGRVLLIDVRRPTEIAMNGGFPVYLNIQAADLEKHLAEIPKDKPLILVSNHAHRAGIAADLLESKGFKIAGAIGAQVYESEGGTLMKYAPEKPATIGEK
jgi:rhodanese-related sulfurtransferase